MSWASTIMAICGEIVVPPLLGYWLDQRLGTRLVFLFAGLALGVTLGTLGFMRVARLGVGRIDGKDDVGQSEEDHS